MKLSRWLVALVLSLSALGAWAQDSVVYHISDADAQALAGLRNVRNHLDADPTARITVVSLGQGVDFMMEGAKDRNGSPYAATVSALVNRGVKFEVCEITLKNRNLKKDQFSMDAEFTPSGVVRIGQLQTREQFGYIKP